MAFEKLKKALAETKYPGVGPERIAIRTMGCWSCKHSQMERAVDTWWKEARQAFLARGAQIALNSPDGEKNERVMAIRKHVPMIDAAMTSHEWTMCDVGVKADGTPVSGFLHVTYLCGKWTGAEGASVAREGAAPDKLPEELMERMGDPNPNLD